MIEADTTRGDTSGQQEAFSYLSLEERLLMAQLLIALYPVGSDRQFCEGLAWSLLFRWLLGMTMDEPGFVQSTFRKNRERLLEHEVASRFFAEVLCQARAENFLSAEHFTVDRTLIESLASLKSERRTNDTHASVTDPDAKPFRMSRAAATKLYLSGNAVAENRCGLIVDFSIDDVLTGEQTAARRHATYRLSQRKRKLIEQAFGWIKNMAGLRKSRFFDRARTEHYALIAMTAYNLTCMARLRPLAT